jgi:hypothetical protein
MCLGATLLQEKLILDVKFAEKTCNALLREEKHLEHRCLNFFLQKALCASSVKNIW